MAGYVYLIGTPIFGWYKIGKSKQPTIRIKDLGILLPFKIKVICVWEAENHSLMEEALHEIHKGNRINGEWFNFTREEIYNLVGAVPISARVYPSEGSFLEHLENFSNIVEDRNHTKNRSGRVLGARIQKLRGDFTPEEREQKRLVAMEQQRLRRSPAAQAAVELKREEFSRIRNGFNPVVAVDLKPKECQ